MVADFAYNKITVSGITGDTPICTKIELYRTTTSGERLIYQKTISDNNPNFTIITNTFGMNSGDKVKVILYDSDNNIIASKEQYDS